MSWTDFITGDVNNSIAKNKHFKSNEVVEIFHKAPETLTHKEMYALETIFTESFLEAFYQFLRENRIDYEKAKELYLFMKNQGVKSEKYDWFFGV